MVFPTRFFCKFVFSGITQWIEAASIHKTQRVDVEDRPCPEILL